MVKLYTNQIVKVEQFTDNYTPKGVQIATQKFVELLSEPYKSTFSKDKNFVFRIPNPSKSDEKVKSNLDSPYPFCWIKKGDYVLTYPNGYSIVESQEYFEKYYKEIKLTH